MKIKFVGAAREVTGSKHIITTDSGKNILLDCGMYQGKGLETDSLNRNLGFDPKDIDYLLISHAHIDHTGLIPYIVKNGFKGEIYCTGATRDLVAIMLADSGKIQEHDTHTFNKKRAKQGLPPIDPIYEAKDVMACMPLFITLPYGKDFFIDENIKIKFTDNGHLLGGGTINLTITENGKTTKIAYTGDIGRPGSKILRSPQPFPQADYIITESTYGNRIHDKLEDAEMQLLDVMKDTCIHKKGKLIIPSFSIGRTQEIVYALQKLKEKSLLPEIDIFVDSPLSTNATTVMRLHPECFNEDLLEYMLNDPDPFGFNRLYYLQTEDDSKRLNHYNKPCVIISASGMMEAGRVKHHIANSIESTRNTILAVGYCAPNTLGAKLLRGEKEVSIFGQVLRVNAEIRRIESYSAHGDYKEMLDFLNCQDKTKVKKVFLVHGEYSVQQEYKKFLNDNGFANIEIPGFKEEVELD